MKKIIKKKGWERHGVSEVVGNILILAITVTLFSSIMYFVTSMPAPNEEVYADFSSQIKINEDGTATINITHSGGQTLKSYRTAIYLFVNGTPHTLDFTDSVGEEWSTGETFSYNTEFVVTQETSLSVMIVDIEANAVVWDSILKGHQTSYPPIIGERGTNRTQLFAGDLFHFEVKVIDPDGDLITSNVYMNATPLGLGNAIPLVDSDNDGVFISPNYTAQVSWNGKQVKFWALDEEGHNSTGRYTLEVLSRSTDGGTTQYGPFYNYTGYLVNGTYPPDATGGESGGSGSLTGTTFYYIRSRETGEITNSFDPAEGVMVEIYSNSLDNLALENEFFLYHPLTGEPLSPQTKSNAFSYGGIFGTFHRYVYNFTAPLEAYPYQIQVKLKDNTGTVVNIIDTITVGSAYYPALRTYKVNETTGQFIETSSFNHTDRIYLRIITRDVMADLSSVYIGTIEVRDYSGKYIIKSLPAEFSPYPDINYEPPVSSLFKTNSTGPTRLPDDETATSAYTVYIEPKDAYQGWWLPRTNSYTLRVSIISENPGETYYGLTTQINITAPLSTTDIVTSIGSGSYTWSSTGAQWENSKLAWFSSSERSDQWKKITIDEDTYDGPIAMILSDIDNDGYEDLVVAYQDPSVSIVWYRNEKADGSQWSETPYLISAAFDAYPGQQTAGGNNKNNNLNDEDTSVWKTYGQDRFYPDDGDYLLNELCADMAAGDFDGDGDQDLVASFMHVVVYTTASSRTSADYSNSWGMFFNRGVYVFWNDGSWTKTALYSTLDWIDARTANANSNPAYLSVDTGDFNQDGYDDIVAVTETGRTDVWFSRYLESAGDKQEGAFSTAASYVSLAPTVAGTDPWDHEQIIPTVKVGFINSDDYPDIVRTSSGSNTVTVFYTVPTSGAEVTFYPDNAWSPGTIPVANVTGSLSNLTANDTAYQNLTEVWKNYPPNIGKPQLKGASDTTGNNLTYLWYDDSYTYNVGGAQTLEITDFNISAEYQGKIISRAVLEIKYKVDSTYNGSDWIKCNGVETPIKPDPSQTEAAVYTYDLLAAGIDTWEEINALKVRFDNTGGSADGAVLFNYIWVNVSFVEGTMLDWVYEIENDYSYPLHELSIVAKCLEAGMSFTVYYSPDNYTWFMLTDNYGRSAISGTVDQEYTYALAHITGEKYYIRIRDADGASDSYNNTLCVNMISIRHYTPAVTWTDANRADITLTGLSGEHLTAIEIGDLGKIWGDYKPDGFADIVVTTSKVGTVDAYHSVFVLVQTTGGGGFTVNNLYTPNLAASVADNDLYDLANVALGDIDGDYDLDIVLVVGYAPGRSGGSAPTLWLLENQPLPTGWQFDDRTINVLETGESAINVVTGFIDLTILIPFLGILGIVVAEAITEGVRRKKE